MTTTPFPLPPGLPPTDTLYYPAHPNATPATYFLFLPGNPGLIEYYRSFLGTLSDLLDRRVHVLGVSHAGFYSRQGAARDEEPHYWTLAEQVMHKVEVVEWIVGGCGEVGEDRERGRRPRVIVAGHSVGAYIAMETLRVLGERRGKLGRSQGDAEGEGEDEDGAEMLGGVMLFPTVVDIAKSPSGKLLSGLLSLTGSRLPPLVSHIARPLSLLPTRLVYTLIRTITAHPPSAAATTLSLLNTPGAVFQALSLARDEIDEITHDKWDYDIWGSEKAGVSRLWFYFGKRDHWVAEETREAIMKTRGRGMGEDWKPKMVLDKEGIPHGFCIDHGEVMAEKVAVWVKSILGE